MQPACIAYSSNTRPVEFIESQEEWDKKWESDEIYYSIEHHGALVLISEPQLKRAVNIAMTTWDIEIPTKFRSAKRGQMSDISIKFEYPEENEYFKDKPSVLAYAYLPGQGSFSGKIVFNLGYIWDLTGKGIKAGDALKKGLITDTNNPDNILRTYNIYHVLIHELGHSIGLKHDANNNTTDVMDPYYKGTTLDLSPNDIYRIRKKYGTRLFTHWTRYMRIKRWLKRKIRQ